jgi:hypothetical protein
MSVTMRLFVLGHRESLYLGMALALIGMLIAWAVFHPAVYHDWCLRHYIPSMQERLGFRAARIPVPGRTRGPLALVEVVPSGPMARAGFRVGDIPVDHHGGETAFCGALQGAEAGGYSKVSVANAADWAAGVRSRRELTIPPVAR